MKEMKGQLIFVALLFVCWFGMVQANFDQAVPSSSASSPRQLLQDGGCREQHGISKCIRKCPGSYKPNFEWFCLRPQYCVNKSSGRCGYNNPPTRRPTPRPTRRPTDVPTMIPTNSPSKMPTRAPTISPSKTPTISPSKIPTITPSKIPTISPSKIPTTAPSKKPTRAPSMIPTPAPPRTTTISPSQSPFSTSSQIKPSLSPTRIRSQAPSFRPSLSPKPGLEALPSATPTRALESLPATPKNNPSDSKDDDDGPFGQLLLLILFCILGALFLVLGAMTMLFKGDYFSLFPICLALFDFITDGLFAADLFSRDGSQFATAVLFVVGLTMIVNFLLSCKLLQYLHDQNDSTMRGMTFSEWSMQIGVEKAIGAYFFFALFTIESFQVSASGIFGGKLEAFNAPLTGFQRRLIVGCSLANNFVEDIPQLVIIVVSQSVLDQPWTLSAIASFCVSGASLLYTLTARSSVILLLSLELRQRRRSQESKTSPTPPKSTAFHSLDETNLTLN